jgi:hypothetical protein
LLNLPPLKVIFICNTILLPKAETFIVKKEYLAKKTDDLSINKGDYVQVLEKNLDGWWKARYSLKKSLTFLNILELKCEFQG